MLNFVKSLSLVQKRIVLLAIDLALIPVSYFLALTILYDASKASAAFASAWISLALLLVPAALLSYKLGIPKIRLNAYESKAIGKTAVFTALITPSLYFIGAFTDVHTKFATYVVFALLFFILSFSSRIFLQQIVMGIYRRSQRRIRVLIYGAGRTGMQLSLALKQHETIEVVAFVDDNQSLHGMLVSGLRVRPAAKIRSLAEKYNIDRVLLAMPSVSLPKQSQITRRLDKMKLEVQSLPSFIQLIGEEELVDKLDTISPSHLLGREQVTHKEYDTHQAYEGQSVLITGAGGTIGFELCRQVLAYKPSRIILLDHSEFALYTSDMEIRSLADDIEITSILGSVTNSKLIEKVLSDHQVDVILHAAAYKHVPLVESNIVSGMGNNVIGTFILAKAAKDYGVKRFILVSSDKAVRPTNIMGASKRMAELVIQDLAARSTSTVFSMVRFGNVLGSSGSVVPLFIDQISRGGPVTVTHKDVARYFMTVQEATRLVLIAGSFAKGGEVFVLDMGRPIEIHDLARQIIEAQGYSVCDQDNPNGDIEIIITGLRPGEKLTEELLIGEGVRTTAHPLIFSAHEESLSELEIATAIRSLLLAIEQENESAVMDVINRWVDGYGTAKIAEQKS